MAEGVRLLWWYRVLFLLLCAALFFLHLLPLSPGPGGIPGPDVFVLLAFAWVIMRPELAPMPLIFLVFLLADFLLMRPLGLWAVLALLGSEYLRARSLQLRDSGFVAEWLTVASVIMAMGLINMAVLALFSVTQPALGLGLFRLIITALCYPLVVVLGGRVFGVRKVAPGEMDSLGQRL